jgi:hypothetical protein
VSVALTNWAIRVLMRSTVAFENVSVFILLSRHYFFVSSKFVQLTQGSFD